MEYGADLRIGVFGLGFVGLTTALGFAEKGFSVKGFDIDAERMAIIRQGVMPFLEPGVDMALSRQLGKRFSIAENALDAATDSDVVFFCVGTPCGENGKADLTYLFAALDNILPVLKDGRFRTLVTKSTVPPGTTRDKVLPYLQEKGFKDGAGFGVANNPEFLREGKCWDDFIAPDRIVCGTQNVHVANILQRLYAPFNAPVYIVSPNTAEFVKYLSNTLLASLISYSNEMAMIAESIGTIDVGEAFHILHADKRLRNAGIAGYIYPGCGYGGYCLPKDTQAFAERARIAGVIPYLLDNVITVNNERAAYFTEKIKRGAVRNKLVGLLGLSFKPESDDVRDSPAAKIIRLLLEAGYRILAYDPVANERFAATYKFEGVTYCATKDEVCANSDCIAVATAWEEFKDLPAAFLGKTWIDCRYFLNFPKEKEGR
jgi:UDPglucose 6-dehydrogenase